MIKCCTCKKEMSDLEFKFYNSLYTENDDLGLPTLCPKCIRDGESRFKEWAKASAKPKRVRITGNLHGADEFYDYAVGLEVNVAYYWEDTNEYELEVFDKNNRDHTIWQDDEVEVIEWE